MKSFRYYLEPPNRSSIAYLQVSIDVHLSTLEIFSLFMVIYI